MKSILKSVSGLFKQQLLIYIYMSFLFIYPTPRVKSNGKLSFKIPRPKDDDGFFLWGGLYFFKDFVYSGSPYVVCQVSTFYNMSGSSQEVCCCGGCVV